MFCPNCGKEVKEGTKFCPNCGKTVGLDFSNEVVKKRKFRSAWLIVIIALFILSIGFLGLKVVSLRYEEGARRLRVKNDFRDLSVGLEVFRSDWKTYPISNGYICIDNRSSVYKELTGSEGADLNNSSNWTAGGMRGGICYITDTGLASMINPWDNSCYLYKSSNGDSWILAKKMPNGKYLVRTSYNSTLQELENLP